MYCTICLKEVKENNKVLTNCNHTFHLSCILKNYKYNTVSGNKCPVCRKFLFSNNPENHIISGSTFLPVISPITRPTVVGSAALVGSSENVPRVYYWPPQPMRHNTGFYRQVFNRLKTKLYRNISERNRKMEMLTYANFIVNKLSYNELKEKLTSYGLSKRGYLRETFENKLMHHMITCEGLIV